MKRACQHVFMYVGEDVSVRKSQLSIFERCLKIFTNKFSSVFCSVSLGQIMFLGIGGTEKNGPCQANLRQ